MGMRRKLRDPSTNRISKIQILGTKKQGKNHRRNETSQYIRVVTYNIHKRRGLDRRVSPTRIVAVLREIDADIIALQEVVCIANGAREYD
jgi:hypothetical protein